MGIVYLPVHRYFRFFHQSPLGAEASHRFLICFLVYAGQYKSLANTAKKEITLRWRRFAWFPQIYCEASLWEIILALWGIVGSPYLSFWSSESWLMGTDAVQSLCWEKRNAQNVKQLMSPVTPQYLKEPILVKIKFKYKVGIEDCQVLSGKSAMTDAGHV